MRRSSPVFVQAPGIGLPEMPISIEFATEGGGRFDIVF